MNNHNKKYKTCKTCGRTFPKTLDFFHSNGNGTFKSECKSCRSINRKDRVKFGYHQYNSEKAKVYYSRHKKQIAQRNKRYDDRHKDSTIARKRKWRNEHKKQASLSSLISLHKKEAQDNGLANSYTVSDWKECLIFFEYKCAYCGSKDNIEQDHFIALSNGGSYTKNNIVPCCKKCNIQRSNILFEEWYPKQNFYSEERLSRINEYFKR